MQSRDSGIGVSLADGRREVELLLPVVPTMLRVNSNIDAVRWCDWKPTVTRLFTPEPGKINPLEIVVPSPPAFDPADRR